MRVGIDAGWIEHGPVSGRRVVAGLLDGLHDIDTPHEIVLFTRPEASVQRWNRFEHVTCRRLPTSLVTNVVTMAKAAARARIDAMVFQQFVPLRAPYARCAFVNDSIVFEHPEFFPWVQRLYFRPQRMLLPRADWVVTLTTAELCRMQRLGLTSPERSGTVPCGVDARFFETDDPVRVTAVRERYGLPERFVLYVGRLNRRKNVVNLVRGFLASAARTHGFHLVLVGGREDADPSLDVLLDTSGDVVVELGHVPDDDLPVIYRIADAFAYVSLAEGFGIPPLEAFAAGAPVVAADIPPAREVCGTHAVFVDPHSPTDIGRGVDAALARSDRDLASARAHARTYNWARAAELLVENVEEAVARSDVRSSIPV